MSSWQPIATAPRDGTNVLVSGKAGMWVGYYGKGGNNHPQDHEIAWRAWCCGRFAEPTHWQPMPAPPHTVSKEG